MPRTAILRFNFVSEPDSQRQDCTDITVHTFKSAVGAIAMAA